VQNAIKVFIEEQQDETSCLLPWKTRTDHNKISTIPRWN